MHPPIELSSTAAPPVLHRGDSPCLPAGNSRSARTPDRFKPFRVLAAAALVAVAPQAACAATWEVQPLTEARARDYDLDTSFYKRATFVQGILIATSARVPDHVHLEAAYQFDAIMRLLSEPVARRIRDSKVLCLLVGVNELTSDLPQFGTDKTGAELDFYNWRQRGFLTRHAGHPTVLFAEEDVMEYEGGMQIESILIHEFGHVIHGAGFDKSLQQRLTQTYEAAVKKGLWNDGRAAQRFRRVRGEQPVLLLDALAKAFPKQPRWLLERCLDHGDILVNGQPTNSKVKVTGEDKVLIVFGGEKQCYAGKNRSEYWAEGVQSWFDTNRTMDHDHNHIHTRAQLKEYDPGLAKLCEEVLGDSPWHFVSPRKRAGKDHLATYDPAKAPVAEDLDHIKEAANDYYDTYWSDYWQRLYDKHAPAGILDGASGNIFKVNLANRSFELLKETEYAPKTDLGQSRFTVHWTADTTIARIEEKKSFAGIEGPVIADFHGIDEANSKALKEGRPFVARVAILRSGLEAAECTYDNHCNVVGRFTPDDAEAPRSGTIEIDGKPVKVTLRNRFWRIYHHQPLRPADLATGFWKTTIHGDELDDRFMIESMEVTALADPRTTDDPKLPRVLVIGDSISMNYHESAKTALEGVANYHRNEGNCFSTVHGVRNAELWLGNHHEKGLHWDVIQFNHGLHDLKQAYDKANDSFGEYAVPLDDYKANLEKEIAILKQTGARLIWCATTPVPNHNKGRYARRKGAAREFNQAALEVMGKNPDILVNDLCEVIDGSPVFDNWRKGNDVHFYKEEEQELLGKAVARAVRQALENTP